MRIQGYSGTAAEIREAVGQTVLMTGLTIQQLGNGIPHIRVEPLIGDGLEWTTDSGATVGPHTVDTSVLSVKLGTGLGFDGNGAIQATGTAGVSSLGGATGDLTLGSGLSMAGLVLTLDSDLSDIAALAGANGLLRKTAGVWSLDTATYLTGNQTITLTGDVTGSGTQSFATTLATVNSNVGSFGAASTIPVITVNGKGLITAVSTVTVVAPAGTLTGSTLAAGVTASSLTSVGTLTSLTLSGLLLTTASVAGGAGLRIPHGTAPTTPTNGDVWTTTSGLLAHINGTTQTLTPTSRTITINGTTNQITSSAGSQDLSANRTWTLSLPQNIHTAATPTFAGLTINGAIATTAGAITARQAATQDGVTLQGRAGGTSSWAVTITPTTLSAARTLTLANGDTVLVAGTMVPTSLTLQIANGTGITGGGAAVDLSANRSWTIALTGQALAIHNLGTNGIVARTAADTFTARTITGTVGQITVSNGDGVAGNPTLSLPADVDITTTLDVGSVGAISAATMRIGGDVRASGTIYATDFVLTGGAGSGTGISLDNLSDVIITAAATGEYLRYNGTNWVDSTIQTSDLGSGTANTTTFLRGDRTWAVASLVGVLDDLTDVTITTVASGQYLRYNGSQWVNTTDGSTLTSLSASNISSGTLADARLSSNVPLLNAANDFTSTIRFLGYVPTDMDTHNTTAVRQFAPFATGFQPTNRPSPANYYTGFSVRHNLGGTYVTQFAFGATDTSPFAYRYYNNVSWTAWRYVLSSENYNSYAPTLTGTGASGTWGISVTGSATTLQTSRLLWGQSFNGSTDVGGEIFASQNSSASQGRFGGTSFHNGAYLSSNLYYSGTNDFRSAAEQRYINAAGGSNNAGGLLFIKGNGAESGVELGFYTTPTSTGVGATPASSTLRFRVNGSGAVYVHNGLNVSTGGMTVTGNSTITGTLDGVTTLTLASISASGNITTSAGSISITGGAGRLSVTSTDSTQLAMSRTGSGNNVTISFTNTDATRYFGMNPTEEFGFSNNPDLSASPWATIGATASSFTGTITATGNILATTSFEAKVVGSPSGNGGALNLYTNVGGTGDTYWHVVTRGASHATAANDLFLFFRETGGSFTQWAQFDYSANLLTVNKDTTVSGTMTATTFSGSGASLTALNASNLSSGTVPDAVISGAYSGITTLTVTTAINPSASDTVSLGTASAGFRSLRIEHAVNRALGISLIQTLTGQPSPRLFFGNTTDAPTGAIAIMSSGASQLEFRTGATPDSASGTSRWYLNANGIYPATTNAYALGGASNAWSTFYSVLANVTTSITTPLVIGNNSSSRDKLRVWDVVPYSIGMQNSFTFGGLNTDYAMTFQMSDTAGRGFWWGDSAHGQGDGAMALTTEGKLTVAHSLRLGYGESDTTTPGATYRLDVSGHANITGDIVNSGWITQLSSGTVTTPASSPGWYRVATLVGGTPRGVYRVILSTVGGNWTPTTTVIDCFKDWANVISLNVTKYGTSSQITGVRVVDSSSTYYLEIEVPSDTNGKSFSIYVQRMTGYYNAWDSVTTSGALTATGGGTVLTSVVPVSGGGFASNGGAVFGGTVYATDFILTGGAGSGTGISLDNLSDVVLTSPATNHSLSFNGTNWINNSNFTITTAGATTAAGLITGTAAQAIALTNTNAYGVIGGGTSSNVKWYVRGTSGGSAVTDYGIYLNWTTASTPTTAIYGLRIGTTTPDVSFTTTSVYGIMIDGITKGTSHTITTAYGLYITAPTVGGTNWSIYTTGSGRFGGNLTVSTGGLSITGNSTIAGTLTSLTGLTLSSGLLLTAASVAGTSGFRLPHGAAPTTPTNGDMWTTTAGLYIRINGATVGPLGTGAGGDVTGPGSNTTNAIPIFSGTTGKIIANSTLIFASGAMSGVTTLTMTGALSGATTGSFSTSVTTPLLTQAGAMTISTTAANDMTFQRNSVTTMTLVADGLQVNSAALGVNVAPNATDGRIDAGNDIVAFSSDRRLKTSVLAIKNAMMKIMTLTAMTYLWNDVAASVAGFDTERRYVGLFAQEVQAVLPEAVRLAPFDNDGNDNSISGENYLTVQYEKVVPLLVAGQQETYRLVLTVTDRVKQLEDRMTELERELNALKAA